MRLSYLLCACLVVSSAAVKAESKNPANYPLRVHIMGHSQTTFYHMRSAEESKGEGRANLFEGGEAKGVDFTFDCSQKLKASIGYETYPAKWKKPNQELTVLLPVFGKSNSYFTCNLKTDVKDYAYVGRNGRIIPEPTAEFNAWMVKHDYDPEHGKDVPTRLEPPAGVPAPSGASQ